MSSHSSMSGLAAFGAVSALFVVGFTVLAVRLKEEQIDNAAEHRRDMQSQSFRRVQTSGLRGRIFDRHGVPLADNRLSLDISVNPVAYRNHAKGTTTEERLAGAISALSEIIGRKASIGETTLRRHLRQELARPLVVWRDVTNAELARFAECADEFPGFECTASCERVYPQGRHAAHLVGRVGRDRLPATGGATPNFVDRDMCGREGLELQYDGYLRGMPGEERILVDARGFAVSHETLVAPHDGPDLTLTIDMELQKAAEAELDGRRGALVALDPRDGAVRVLASAPSFDPNEFVPVLTQEVYVRHRDDPDRPLLNRATAGTYAPGSTFKPLTALAGLRTGHGPDEVRECNGAYDLGGMKIRCARTWGHGPLDLAHALRESCNPYFCGLGVAAGTNALVSVARTFGLGARTGIDFPTDAAGVVPTAEWKAAHFTGDDMRWRTGDLAQMSIGQGQLLVTPLQMARVAAALGTGILFLPRLNAALPPEGAPVDAKAWCLDAVRRGMRMVVDGGTGRRAGEGVDAYVIGKTGTAQVGPRGRIRKNTWFIAYATPVAASRVQEPLAMAVVVEDGESGGGTAAPIVASVLRSFYNRREEVVQ